MTALVVAQEDVATNARRAARFPHGDEDLPWLLQLQVDALDPAVLSHGDLG